MADGVTIAVGDVGVWLALVVLAGVVTSSLADALPGIVPFAPLDLRSQVVGLVGAALVALLAVPLAVAGGRARGVRDAVRIAASRSRVVLRRLGLTKARYRWPTLLAAGTAGSVLAIASVEVLIRVPALAATAEEADARMDAVAGAPAWSTTSYFAIYSPLPEELAFRGLLLLAVAGIVSHVPHTTARRALVAVALVISSTLFGVAHLDWSTLNAVTAGTNGLVYGLLAVGTRSLWPAVLAHCLYNLWVGASVAGLLP